MTDKEKKYNAEDVAEIKMFFKGEEIGQMTSLVDPSFSYDADTSICKIDGKEQTEGE